ncbi:hypothetical protein [Parvibaculum sp.]|uniref:hypothetical protein n=1 Tax=Parvibaculum sp. TaxID=2024848 RepID=UPI001B1F9FBA|nr:hypothetical protein [Parvibaculum sp.]MBO6635937.1 hypothetical protein [Parvibaculum sp.]MBO6679463.1 hypothetical protein [Parvibaculum sp.]MBO6685612.1 hypothetical protein [Parvibaculum sp.]MBO6906045.1 hypothetical protein [Parvibaculum sp.]
MGRFRLEHLLVGSLLANAALLGFIAALLLAPGPRPAFFAVRADRMPMAVKLPEFDMESRLFLARLLERDAEAAAERARRAAQARAAFSEALSQENSQADEIAARGEDLKAAMDALGEGFLDAIVAAAPELAPDERRKLADFFLRLPADDLVFPGQEGAGIEGPPGFPTPPFGVPGPGFPPPGQGEGVEEPAGLE